MKVNINIDKIIVGKIDEIARREKRSRSQVIQLMLENILKPGKFLVNENSGRSKYARFFGCWEGRETAEELVQEVRASRERNLRSKKAKL
jgi:metal-responsive CopG/Arc/MetJ family transcriptional regulator